MIGKLNHVAIAVPSVSNAADQYKNILGAKVSKPLDLPDHGVKTVFVELDNTKIELLEPIGKNSPIENFLKKNPSGGMHHICMEVEDINKSLDLVINAKFRNTSICGATESLIIDNSIIKSHLPIIIKNLKLKGCKVYGDDNCISFDEKILQATENDWYT